MDSKSLMIGDWYQWYADGKYYQYKVKAEDFTKEYVANYEPIPLTAEILEKNGFKQNSAGYMSTCDFRNFQLLNGIEGWYIKCSDFYPNIRFVHELQHALRLCGLNELADNFKV